MTRLYFDAHATTPCDPLVVEAMLPFFTSRFGNAASLQHAFGWEAQQAVESARQHVAELVGARLRDVIFTSGATEANNLVLRGVIDALATPASRLPADGAHVVTLATEHPAVLEPCAFLESLGVRVTRVPVRTDGIVGFGEAARLARARRAADAPRLAALRDRLWTRLREALPGVHLRGAERNRLPHNLNVGFEDLTGRDLVLGLTDVAVSPGAACASTSAAPSHVLLALGLSVAEARSSLRFGLLRTTTEGEVDELADRLIALVTALRSQRSATVGQGGT